jgi:PAS domain S-box-containing protein
MSRSWQALTPGLAPLRRSWSRLPLGHKLLVLLVGAIVITTSLLMLATWHTLGRARARIEHDGQQVLALHTEQFLDSLVRQYANILDGQLSQARSAASHLGFFLSHHLDSARPGAASIPALLANVQQQAGRGAVVYAVSLEGELWLPPGHSLWVTLPEAVSQLQQQAAAVAVLEQGLGETRWGAVQVSPIGAGYDLAIDAMSPVRTRDGKPWGFVGVSLSLASYIVAFNQNQPIRSSYLFVLDDRSRLIAAPPQGRVELASPATYRPRGLLELKDTGNTQLDLLVQRMSLGGSAIQAVPIKGELKYVAYHPLSTIDWRIGVVVSVSMATAASGQLAAVVGGASDQALLSMLLSSGLFLALCLVPGVLLTIRLVRPLREMARATERIGKGSPGQRVAVTSEDEIGALGQVFNSMSAYIEELIESLRRQADALRQTNTALLHSMSDGVVVTDGERRLLLWNPEAERIFGEGLKEGTPLSSNFTDGCFLPDQRTPFPDDAHPLAQAARGEPSDHVEMFIHNARFPEGLWLSVTARPLRQEGRLQGGVMVLRDITPAKRAEAALQRAHDGLEQKVMERTAELREAQRRLVAAAHEAGMAEVATSVLHNVGNVLNSINVGASLMSDRLMASRISGVKGVSELLRTHQADLASFFRSQQGQLLPEYLEQLSEALAAERSELQKHLKALRDNIEHIRHIIVMQQGYARRAMFLEPVSPVELVEDALRINETSLRHEQVEIVREYQELPLSLFEKHKSLQILVNLVSNARHALAASPSRPRRLTVRVNASGENRLRIQVIDNGQGISSENLSRIFNYGFTTRADGHGFGLHSSALAAQDMGGTLTVHSDGPGQGATFTLELPYEPRKT